MPSVLATALSREDVTAKARELGVADTEGLAARDPAVGPLHLLEGAGPRHICTRLPGQYPGVGKRNQVSRSTPPS